MTRHRAAALLTTLLTLAILPADLAAAEPAPVRDLTAQFVRTGLDIERLQAFEVGGIVVLRGRTYERSAAEALGRHAQRLGDDRVANLIQIVELPDDAEIRRLAEQELAYQHALEGARLRVASEKGVVVLTGSVSHQAQADVAVAVLRSLEGVRSVRVNTVLQ